MSARNLAKVGIIAALYAALTLALAPISYGPLQFRVSEALTILPFLTPLAIPGLTVGCLVANLLGPGYGFMDIVFGTLATLLAALLTWRAPKAYLAPLPPVLINAIVVGWVINFTTYAPIIPTMLYVGLGELVVCYVIGYPLLIYIERNQRLGGLLTK